MILTDEQNGHRRHGPSRTNIFIASPVAAMPDRRGLSSARRSDAVHARVQTLRFLLLFVLPGPRARTGGHDRHRPTGGASPELTETVSRLHGELLSLGLEVAFAEPSAGPAPRPADPRARLQPIATARDADAVIELDAALGAATVDIYVLDRRTHRSEVSRVALESSTNDGPARLAIRTIEVLRSRTGRDRFGGTRARGTNRGARGPRGGARDARGGDRGRSPRPRSGCRGVSGRRRRRAGAPSTVRVGWATRSGLVLHAALAASGAIPPSPRRRQRARRPAVRPARKFHRRAIDARRPVQPYVALAAGVMRTAIDGEASRPRRRMSSNCLSFLVDGSIGARVNLPGRTFFTLAAHVQVAEPYVAVHIADTLVATSGRPNFLPCSPSVPGCDGGPSRRARRPAGAPWSAPAAAAHAPTSTPSRAERRWTAEASTASTASTASRP